MLGDDRSFRFQERKVVLRVTMAMKAGGLSTVHFTSKRKKRREAWSFIEKQEFVSDISAN